MVGRRMSKVVVAGVLLLAGWPAAAQSGARFEVAPRLGYLVPLEELGPVAPADGAWYLELQRPDPAPLVGGTARMIWPAAGLAAGVQGWYALASDVAGRFDCYPDIACPAVLLEPASARTRVWATGIELQFSPLSAAAALRPFLIGGAGVLGHEYSWTEAPTLVGGGQHAERALALQGGLGLELDLFGAPLRLQATDYWTGEGDRLVGATLDQAGLLRRAAQHDLNISLGWQLVRF